MGHLVESKTITVGNPITAPDSFSITPNNVVEGGDYTLRWSNPGNATKIRLFERTSTTTSAPLKEWNSPSLVNTYTPPTKPVGAYYYQLQACNSLECSPLSVEKSATVNPNQSPTINWLNGGPHGDTFNPEVEVEKTLYVEANDSDGSIQKVEFFEDSDNGTRPLGTATKDSQQCQNCYRLNWTPVNWTPSEVAQVEIWATATDNLGASSSLSGQKATITIDPNSPPSGRLLNPPNEIAQYSSVILRAEAEDTDGTLTSVKFLLNGSSIGSGTENDGVYELPWTSQYSGNFILAVEVTDNKGLSHVSNTHSLSVTAVTVPAAPTSLKIDGEAQPEINHTGNYALAWALSAGTEEYQVEHSIDGSAFQPLATTEVEGLYQSNQSPGEYRYQVLACNPAGCSEPSEEIAITVEALVAPLGLSARPYPDSGDSTPEFTDSYTLGWSPVSTGEVLYKLQEKPGGLESLEPWKLIEQGTETSFIVENKNASEYAYRVLVCAVDDEQICSEPSNHISVSVLSPVLTMASLSCDGDCIALSGLGMDPNLSLTLTGVADQDIHQTFSTADSALDFISTGSLQVFITPDSPLYQQLFELGVRATVTNPNGTLGGITAYGDRATEIIGETSSSPAIGPNGTLYVGAGNQLHALKENDGSNVQELGWPFTAGGIIRATPSIDSVDGTIYVGALDEIFYAVAPNAIEKWRLPTRGKVVSQAVQDEQRILYFGTIIGATEDDAEENIEGQGGILYAVNATADSEQERIKWTYPVNGGIAKEPVLAGTNTLYFSTVESEQIYALTRDNEGPGKLVWESVGDPSLWEDIGNWQPDPSREPEFLSVARLFRSLLQPELPFHRKILTFWTFQLIGGSTTEQGIAEAFLASDSGQANFPDVFSISDPEVRAEAFVDTLYQRLFPGQGQPDLTWGGRSYTREALIMTAEQLSLAHAAALFAQSEEYVLTTNAVLRQSFKYLYEQDYSWAVTTCDEGDIYTRDCDGDGLPDWWEILFLGNTSYGADDDPDRDGVSNIEAFTSRTSPCINGCYNGIVETPPEPSAPILPEPEAVAISAETGTLPGEFRVSESGAATYSIPLSLPAGTAGVVPQLSLNYSSQRGNGLLGHGWQLGGLSSITRCRQTLGQDDNNSPITWGSEDRFCLDGQRLLLVNGGNYGEPDSQYRTEIDSFGLVTAHGGGAGKPAYFTVERKDGSISYYGRDIQGNNATQAFDGYGILSWAVSRTEDSAGNPIDFFYDRDGGHRIREVHYAYGAGNNSAASVFFDYEAREDVISGYVAGAPLTISQRLHAIQVKGTQSTPLRRYELDYLQTDYDGDTLSRVERLRECAGTVCHPDTVFEWRLPAIFTSSYLVDTVRLSHQSDRAAVAPRPADINGDGRMDIAWLEVDWDDDGKIHDHYVKYVLAEEQGFGPEQQVFKYGGSSRSPYRWEVLDYNADGRSDVAIFHRQGKYSGQWMLHQSVYSASAGKWQLSTVPKAILSEKDARFMDINGDGLVDAVTSSGYRLLEPSGESTGSDSFYHFGPEQPWQMPALEPFVLGNNESTALYLSPDVIGDFDGDGQVDLILIHTKQTWEGMGGLQAQKTRAYIAKVRDNQLILGQRVMDDIQEDGFKSDSDDRDATPLERHEHLHRKLQAVDINSDGLVDLVQHDKTGEVNYRYWLNTGAGLNDPIDLGSFPEDAQPSWFDYEGDGDVDLVWRLEGGSASDELRLRRWQSDQQAYAAEEGFKTTRKESYNLFLDMNGDGITDWMEFADDYLRVYHAADHQIIPNVIEKITNGLGAETNILFGSSVTSDHYARLDIDTVLDTHCSNGDTEDIKNWCTQYKMGSTADFYRELNGDLQGHHTLGKTGPLLEVVGSQVIVTRVESSAPATESEAAGAADPEATSAISYFYGRARLQAGGRGLLGFASLRTIDEQSGIKTTTHYRQDFPFLGYPRRTETHTAEDKLLSKSDSTWALQGWQSDFPTAALSGTAQLGPLKPFLSTSVEKSYDFVGDGQTQGDLLKTITTSTEQDEHGNPTRILAVTTAPGGDRFSTETINDYGSGRVVFQNPQHTFNGYAELGRLSSATVTHSRTEAGQSYRATRRSSFTYYESGYEAGLLQKETLEPGDLHELIARYEYDSFGNKILAEQSTANEPPRSQRWLYDDSGRFVDKEMNVFDQTLNQVRQRNAAGQPTEMIDSVGVVSQIIYDVFGRQVHSYSATGAQSSSLLAPAGALCPDGASIQQHNYSGGGSETLICFDRLAREIRKASRAFDGSWNYVDIEYDNVGRVKHQSEPYITGGTSYWTTYNYDRLGRVIGTDLPGISNSGGTRWDLTVEYQGTTITSSNPKGQRQVETNNVLGEKLYIQDNANNILEFTHDAEGQLLQVTNRGDGSRNLITKMTYDLFGRKTSMSDPDKGIWQYDYNGYGELIRQTDANGQVVENFYDQLGRLFTRIDFDNNNAYVNTTVWLYNNDVVTDGSGVPPTALVRVEEFETGNSDSYSQLYGYDAYGRSSETLTSFSVESGDDHYEKTTYDQFSRPFQIFDAGGSGNWESSAIRHHYNQYGYLHQIVDAEQRNLASAERFYTVLEMDARGNVTKHLSGNGVTTVKDYDPATGRLLGKMASVLGIGDIQDLRYEWDNLGNLKNREEHSGDKNLRENFVYDELNRLTSTQVTGREAQITSYDDLGNITYKSDVGEYRYGSQCDTGYGPHAVCETIDEDGNTVSYQYDHNGNMLEDSSGRSLKYSTFDKPIEIKKYGHKTEFKYGPDRMRFLRIDTDKNGAVTETRTIGNVEKITRAGTTEIKRYLPGGALITLSTSNGDNETQFRTTQYLHTDHLGSLDVVTDNHGRIANDGQAIYSFDAWGQRRNAQSWEALLSAELSEFDTRITTRGYTGHEMLDQVGLIHMNGRIYDAKLGRFLQADPIIQFPSNTQSYNRYSYVLNNPLKYTDPSGHFIPAVVGIVMAIAKVKVAYIAITVGVLSFAQALHAGANFGDALIAGVSAAALSYVGGTIAQGTGFGFNLETLGFSVLGGITGALQGGKFGHGFISAGMGAFTGGMLQGVENVGVQVVARSIVGGTMSKITGGKFANGAAFGAFSALVEGFVKHATKITNDLKLKSCGLNGSVCKYNDAGELLTDGGRGSKQIEGTDPGDGNFITNGGMAPEGSGQHLYDENSMVGRFVNKVSKVHDYFNSDGSKLLGFKGYDESTGLWLSGSETYNTAYQVYSFAGMLPAAAVTASALTTNAIFTDPYVPSAMYNHSITKDKYKDD
ncbi:RHS repeat-associated core domain-containing protein [Microbulbifer sp. PSTR4-B]|uniref:RHS repeat-associated core domain-containing protein n=1 Tax=Microbulbifer sp. PSTR4-B TaxID=3243396 RepID=UPI00403A7367